MQRSRPKAYRQTVSGNTVSLSDARKSCLDDAALRQNHENAMIWIKSNLIPADVPDGAVAKGAALGLWRLMDERENGGTDEYAEISAVLRRDGRLRDCGVRIVRGDFQRGSKG